MKMLTLIILNLIKVHLLTDFTKMPASMNPNLAEMSLLKDLMELLILIMQVLIKMRASTLGIGGIPTMKYLRVMRFSSIQNSMGPRFLIFFGSMELLTSQDPSSKNTQVSWRLNLINLSTSIMLHSTVGLTSEELDSINPPASLNLNSKMIPISHGLI